MKIKRPFGAAMRLAVLAFGTALGALMPSAAQAGSVTITLDNPNLSQFYPNAQDPTMPGYYVAMKGFPQTLQQSILQFTKASVGRDGIPVDVAVTVAPGTSTATVTLSSNDPTALQQAAGYVKLLPAFMDSGHAGLGWAGATACQGNTTSSPRCWDPYPGKSPWAFYLPLGLPLVNQKTVMLLNYPPSDALCSGDYLSNFTMARWTSVLQRVGITDPLLYETIVDVHPIAAPGSGQSGCIANTTPYFSTKTPPNYDLAMLDLLLLPAAGGATTVPLQVAGADALSAWATITGASSVIPGSVGTFIRPGQPAVPWVATNHPDVTTYQFCPGDPNNTSTSKPSQCNPSSTTYVSDQLVQDELMDLQAACALQALATTPGLSPQAALAQCQTVWCTADNGICRKQDVCVQARLDYSFTSPGQCKCQQAAEAFCAANANNACPSTTSLTSCAEFNTKYCGGNPTPKYSTCTSLAPSTKK
jgi:hypothetical protein